MSRKRTALSGGVLGVIAVAVSCRDATQMTIRITTSQPCRQLSVIQTFVGPSRDVMQQRFESRFVTATSDTCDPSTGLIGTLVITPGGGEAGTVLVAAGVQIGDLPPPDAATCSDPEVAKRCIIARRAFVFIDHASLALPINLDPLCIGKPCDPATTCFKGACVDSSVVCQGESCGLPGEGIGVGGASDGGSADGASYDSSFFDAADDVVDADRGNDGALISDAMPDADGGPSTSPMCAFSSPTYYCGPGPNGLLTAGSCDNTNPLASCCRCTCPTTLQQVGCTTAGGSCSNLTPNCPP